ncbi:MAG: beta-eliminating lyase-related protein [Actinomycetota bacterium]|nr:beta-eliminating lyase-related protein [Actinomycetota bacterium]
MSSTHPGVVDLRSDTVTRPTAEMRRAMADAEVGDDVYGEDPTVSALEEVFAARLGMEASLFVPSGTMANQVALRLLAAPGTSVVAGARQHVVVYENGAGGRNAAVQFHTVADDDGTISPSDVIWALEAADHHYPRPGLVCVENTHMPAHGAPWPIDALRTLRGAAGPLPLHMDGARLFNAEMATGTGAATYAAQATTVMCCLSKGLCAPVGSLLAGPADLMSEARGERRRLGGAMRQAGVIAAAGLVALRTMVERLHEDHRRARRLAEAVAERWPEGGCDPDRVLTNIVTWRHRHSAAVLDHLGSEAVLAGTIAPGVLRLVTHHDVDEEGVERVAKALAGAPS